MNKELKEVKVCLGRFQPFTLGHLKLATYSDLNGPDKDQLDSLRETPDLKKISSQRSIILVVSTPKEKVDSRHPFDDELMKKEFDLIKKKYSDKIEDIFYVKSADICAWGELLKSKGYCASVWLTGTDEFTFYKGMAMKVPEYEEKNRDNRDCKGAYTKSFYVEEIKRDENSTDFTETISGTKVRESLRNDDKELFKKMMPDGVDSLFDEFKESLLNAPESKPKKTKKIKESKIVNYIKNKNIKNINNYILEKLNINKDTKIVNYWEDIITFFIKVIDEIGGSMCGYWFDSYKNAEEEYNMLTNGETKGYCDMLENDSDFKKWRNQENLDNLSDKQIDFLKSKDKTEEAKNAMRKAYIRKAIEEGEYKNEKEAESWLDDALKEAKEY